MREAPKTITPDQALALFHIVDGLFCDQYVTDEQEVIVLLNEIDGGDREAPTGWVD